MKHTTALALICLCLFWSPAFAQEDETAEPAQAQAQPGEPAPQEEPAEGAAADEPGEPSEPSEASAEPTPALERPHNPLMPGSDLPHHRPTPVEAVPETFKPAPKPDDDPLSGVGGDGLRVVRIKEPKPPVLYVNPELSLGGMFSNYRSLGNFAYLAFGGGVGTTFREQWHFRLNVWALGEPHQHRKELPSAGEEPVYEKQTRTLWFVQPAAYAMYNLARYPDYHYFIPMDLYFGVKVGANIFRTDKPFYRVKDEANFLYGVALYPRFYVYKRAFGFSPTVELSTIDYLRNFFLHYGVTVFWDFEVIGAPGE